MTKHYTFTASHDEATGKDFLDGFAGGKSIGTDFTLSKKFKDFFTRCDANLSCELEDVSKLTSGNLQIQNEQQAYSTALSLLKIVEWLNQQPESDWKTAYKLGLLTLIDQLNKFFSPLVEDESGFQQQFLRQLVILENELKPLFNHSDEEVKLTLKTKGLSQNYELIISREVLSCVQNKVLEKFVSCRLEEIRLEFHRKVACGDEGIDREPDIKTIRTKLREEYQNRPAQGLHVWAHQILLDATRDSDAFLHELIEEHDAAINGLSFEEIQSYISEKTVIARFQEMLTDDDYKGRLSQVSAIVQMPLNDEHLNVQRVSDNISWIDELLMQRHFVQQARQTLLQQFNTLRREFNDLIVTRQNDISSDIVRGFVDCDLSANSLAEIIQYLNSLKGWMGHLNSLPLVEPEQQVEPLRQADESEQQVEPIAQALDEDRPVAASPAPTDPVSACTLIQVIQLAVNSYVDWVRNGAGSKRNHGDKGVLKAIELKEQVLTFVADFNKKPVNLLVGICKLLHDFYNNEFKDHNGNKMSGKARYKNHSFISFLINALKDDKKAVADLNSMKGRRGPAALPDFDEAG